MHRCQHDDRIATTDLLLQGDGIKCSKRGRGGTNADVGKKWDLPAMSTYMVVVRPGGLFDRTRAMWNSDIAATVQQPRTFILNRRTPRGDRTAIISDSHTHPVVEVRKYHVVKSPEIMKQRFIVERIAKLRRTNATRSSVTILAQVTGYLAFVSPGGFAASGSLSRTARTSDGSAKPHRSPYAPPRRLRSRVPRPWSRQSCHGSFGIPVEGASFASSAEGSTDVGSATVGSNDLRSSAHLWKSGSVQTPTDVSSYSTAKKRQYGKES